MIRPFFNQKLNLCCGETKVKDFINIDINPIVKPDLVLDITKEVYPYEDLSIDEIRLMHGLEHIDQKYWDFIFVNAWRVLSNQGLLILGYPEFSKCLQNWLDNKDDNRFFWSKTIYGRRLWPGDEHVTPCDSTDLVRILESYGFYRIKYAPESPELDYYTLMVCHKNPDPDCREWVLAREIGMQGEPVSIEALK